MSNAVAPIQPARRASAGWTSNAVKGTTFPARRLADTSAPPSLAKIAWMSGAPGGGAGSAIRLASRPLTSTRSSANRTAHAPERACFRDAVPRQVQLCACVKLGESNKEIAYRLSIAQPTVSFHIAEVRRKLDVPNNRKIVERALELGLL